MNLEERDRVLLKLQAGWTKPMPDSMLVLFSDRLTGLVFDQAQAAVDMLIDTKPHRPAWADFRECYQAARRATPERSIPAPACSMCEDGWIDVTPPGSSQAVGTVAPCPNGCKPPTAAQRQERAKADEAAWQREMSGHPREVDERVRAASRSFSEPDREERF